MVTILVPERTSAAKHEGFRDSRHFISSVGPRTLGPERAVALRAQDLEVSAHLARWWGVPARLGDVALLVGDVLEHLRELCAVG